MSIKDLYNETEIRYHLEERKASKCKINAMKFLKIFLRQHPKLSMDHFIPFFRKENFAVFKNWYSETCKTKYTAVRPARREPTNFYTNRQFRWFILFIYLFTDFHSGFLNTSDYSQHGTPLNPISPVFKFRNYCQRDLIFRINRKAVDRFVEENMDKVNIDTLIYDEEKKIVTMNLEILESEKDRFFKIVTDFEWSKKVIGTHYYSLI